MSYLRGVIDQFIDVVETKKKCTTCQNDCTSTCIDCLNYFNGVPSYDCDYKRYFYAAKYLYVHKAEVKRLVEDNITEIETFLSYLDNELTIASFGAGPGSDTAGILEATMWSSLLDEKHITLYRIDIEDNWVNQYRHVIDAYIPYLEKDCSATISKKKLITDIGNPKFNLISSADIVSMSYVMSEMVERHGEQSDRAIIAFWNKAKKSLSNNAILLINDRPQRNIINSMKLLVNEICSQYPESYFYDYTFSSNSYWCKEHFPDEYKQKYQPKLFCSSSQFIVFLKK